MVSTSAVHTLRPLPELDYYDCRSTALAADISVLEAWNIITAQTGWFMRLAFRVRDRISSLFGVKRIGGFSGTRPETVGVGDYLDFFRVEHCAPDVLVLTERDRHLDVMICLSIKARVATITSSVVTHNAFGRAYMVPVGPAHKVIITRNLQQLQRTLAERVSPLTDQ